MAAVHFSSMPWEPNTASRHIESHIFFFCEIPVARAMCMLGLKFIELFSVYLLALLGFSYAKDFG